mgnify:CR=1 FL=1
MLDQLTCELSACAVVTSDCWNCLQFDDSAHGSCADRERTGRCCCAGSRQCTCFCCCCVSACDLKLKLTVLQ